MSDVARRRRSATSRLTTTDHDVLTRFRDIVQMGTISGPTTMGGNKPYWTWSVGRFESVQHLICLFWPFFGIRRKAKAKELLRSYCAFPIVQKQGFKRPRVRLTQQEVAGIHSSVADGTTQSDTAMAFGVSSGLVSRIVNGLRHHDGGAL